LAIGIDITHGEIHGVAQNAVQNSLVSRDIVDITVVVLTDGKHADGLLKFLPEGLLDLCDGINAQTIAVVGGKRLDVLDKILTNEGVSLVEIRKARKTAVLDFRLVVPVLDIAAAGTSVAVVVVLNAVERNELTVAAALTLVTHVVSNDIDHEIHATVMKGVLQADEVRKCTEMLVDGSDILSPIAVIALVGILDDRTDPNCIKAHTLNVIKLLFNALESTTAILG